MTERIPVGELMPSRLYQGVMADKTHKPEYFRGLVRTAEAEHTLNGDRLARHRQFDGAAPNWPLAQT